MTLPVGTFNDSYFKREIGQPSFSITEYFTPGLVQTFWAPSDFDFLIFYSPDKKNGNFTMEIMVEAIENENSIRKSKYGPYTRTSSFGYGTNEVWRPMSERLMHNPSRTKGNRSKGKVTRGAI